MSKKNQNKANVTETFSNEEILTFAIQSGMLQSDTVLNEMVNMKRKEFLEQHKYAITTTLDKKTGKTIYSTYLPTETDRVYRRRNTLEELEDVIVAYYKDKQEKVYISTIYEQWVEKKLAYGEIIEGTRDRYDNAFKQFFVAYTHPIQKKELNHITTDDLEDYIKSAIHDLSLTVKAYQRLRSLILGIFKHAKSKKHTSISITEFFGDLELSKNMFQQRVINTKTEIFMEDEISLVTEYLRENEDIKNLGLLLMFQTGLRVGELCTLKSTDLEDNEIHVRHIEHKFKENGKWKFSVKDSSKTPAGNRDLLIPSSAIETWQKIVAISPNREYLFEDKNGRIRGDYFNKRLTSICKKLNIPHRSTHKIRKTYGTTLLDNKLDDSFIKEQMGHSDISTTRKLYYFSNARKETKQAQIEKVVSF